jgi:hypothetical protein
MARCVVLVAVLAVAFVAAGCSAPPPKTGQLSGQVTFKGQPVPAGFISFMPEASGGGAGGKVKVFPIKDGVYDTSQGDNPGVFPGPNVVRIAGYDGKPLHLYPQGKQIFNPFELKETLEEGSATKNFTVPDSAADNLKIEPTADQ